MLWGLALMYLSARSGDNQSSMADEVRTVLEKAFGMGGAPCLRWHGS